MTIRQQINNWIYGENSREYNRFHHYSDKATVERFAILTQIQPDGAKIFGIDISHWNAPETVDFQELKAQYNLQFVILKGCDGSLNSNYYVENLQAVKAAGLLFGMYVWLYPASKVNIDAQVNAWHARAQNDPPPMGIFIDCEWTYYGGAPANPSATDLRLAHDKLKALEGKSAITYTAKGYADSYLKGFDWSREELWVANYNVPAPAMPIGATSYTFWQFTSTFLFNGKNYDGDYFNGTQEQFNARYSGTVTPPTGDTMSYKGIVVKTVRIRNADNTDAGGLLYVGDVVYGEVKLSFGLNRIFYNRIYRLNKPVQEWVGNSAVTDGTSTLITTLPGYTDPGDVVTPPPPPPADSVTLDIVLHDVKVAGDAYTANGVKATKTG
jgi:GH25 family lysozyme M1 (1,4-beta-N-acetylmuramidase)